MPTMHRWFGVRGDSCIKNALSTKLSCCIADPSWWPKAAPAGIPSEPKGSRKEMLELGQRDALVNGKGEQSVLRRRRGRRTGIPGHHGVSHAYVKMRNAPLRRT